MPNLGQKMYAPQKNFVLAGAANGLRPLPARGLAGIIPITLYFKACPTTPPEASPQITKRCQVFSLGLQ